MTPAEARGPAFPADFLWGASTSAYQVEGAAEEDGRGLSAWDTFSREEGRIADRSTGDVAADQYHRYADDIALMKQLGLRSYRFSISWSRVLPTGAGQVNQKGLDYYRRLVDELLGAGIQPMPTLWHWDTPQTLQDKGGWEIRETAQRFGDYSEIVFGALGSDVPLYLTLNEPKTVVDAGYTQGIHAPGKRDLPAATRVLHHLLLGHGLAVQALRASGIGSEVAPALNLGSAYPNDDSDESKWAALLGDSWENRLYLDPIFHGTYPQEGLDEVIDKPALDSVVQDGDLAIISTPIDVLGVNYYQPSWLGPGRESIKRYPLAEPTTWLQIYPPGLYDILTRLHRDYGQPRMVITENGRPTMTQQAADGSFPDDDRIEFLRDHLAQAHGAMDAGVKLEGYQLWSFMDNFEWAEGYLQRWGLVHVDYETLQRTPKKSYYWYADVIANNSLPA